MDRKDKIKARIAEKTRIIDTERQEERRGAIKKRIAAKLAEQAKDIEGPAALSLKDRIYNRIIRGGVSLNLGRVDNNQTFWLSPEARRLHMHVVGASGKGKSKFLEGLIRQDIVNGDGMCLIDPHGYLFKDLVTWCAEMGFLDQRRPKNIFLFDPSASDWSFGFNPLPSEMKDLSFAVDSMIKGIVKVWGSTDTDQTPLLDRCLRGIFYVLAERRLSLLEATKLLKRMDGNVRAFLTKGLKYLPELIQDDWQHFNSMKPKDFEDYFMSTINRLGRFVNDPTIQTIVGQTKRILDVRKVMDEGAVVLVNLGTSARPEDNKITCENLQLLGTLIINEFLARSKERPEGSRPFYLYVDECSLFVNQDIRKILEECRKFGLHLILAHQTLSQLRDEKSGGSESIYQGVMGGAQTKVVFGGLPAEEAEVMAKELYFQEFDLKHVKSTKPTVVGQEVITLKSRSSSSTETETDMETKTDGANTLVGKTEVETSFLDQSAIFSDKKSNYVSASTGSNSVEGSSSQRGTGHGAAKGFSETEGEHETLKSVFKDLPAEYYTPEDERLMAAQLLKGQRTQYAIIKEPEGRPAKVKTPTVPDPSALVSKVKAFKKRSHELSFFASPRAEIEAEITERHRQIEHLAQQARQSDKSSEPQSYAQPEPEASRPRPTGSTAKKKKPGSTSRPNPQSKTKSQPQTPIIDKEVDSYVWENEDKSSKK